MMNALLPTPFVWVINHNPHTHTDKYAGVLIDLEPDNPVLLPADIASVLLGWGDVDKTRCLLRCGRIQPGDSAMRPEAKKWIENFHIEPAEYAPPQGFRQREGVTGSDNGQGAAGNTPPNAKKMTPLKT